MKHPLKIAIVNRFSSVGGYHLEKALLLGIRKIRPDWAIDYYCDINRRQRNDDVCEEYRKNGIQISYYSPYLPATRFRLPILNALLNGLNYTRDFTGLCLQRIASLAGADVRASFKIPGVGRNDLNYDAVLYTWPFQNPCPSEDLPVFFIPHDLNFVYFFGTRSYDFGYVKKLYDGIASFVHHGNAIVSSRFMMEDVLRSYPDLAGRIRSVPSPLMLQEMEVTHEKRGEILRRFGITKRFFLYPCNLQPHKNIANLASAVARCRRRGHDVALVIVGFGTEELGRSTVGDCYVVRWPQNENDWTIAGLGQVSDEELNALILESVAVVTSSLYEAGNGPGIDAWRRGVPVAMSDLPFNTEHCERDGVRAALFDPMNADSIADALESILLHPEQAAADALHSMEQMKKIPLDKQARGYIELIEDTLKNRELVDEPDC